MDIIIAKHAGFCFGVKRALKLTNEKLAEVKENLYTLGPLIHNPQVVEELKKSGVNIANAVNDMDSGTVIVRSHGVGPQVFAAAQEKGLDLLDATCPFVKNAQKLAKKLYDEGYQVVVVGDKNHPEVAGINEWTDSTAIVVANVEEAEALTPMKKVGVVAQTTQPKGNFEPIVKVLENKAEEIVTHNTICSATTDRQDAVVELANQVELLLVVGGKNSANTKKLALLGSEQGVETYHIESAAEIEEEWVKGVKRVGITAGASTPDWLIEEVVVKVGELNLPN